MWAANNEENNEKIAAPELKDYRADVFKPLGDRHVPEEIAVRLNID